VQSDSVMFSLRELARMEEERVREEAAERERERQARQQAERGALERIRREAEARHRAQAEAEREQVLRLREEQVRIEALQRAAMEEARRASDAKARADERERERQHELNVERASAAARGMRLRSGTLGAVLGVLVGASGAMAAGLGVVTSREQAHRERAETEIASREDAIRELRSGADATQGRLRSLEESLATLRGDNQRLQEELDDARRHVAHRAPGHATLVPGASHAADPKLDGFTTCPPGSKDPLCIR